MPPKGKKKRGKNQQGQEQDDQPPASSIPYSPREFQQGQQRDSIGDVSRPLPREGQGFRGQPREEGAQGYSRQFEPQQQQRYQWEQGDFRPSSQYGQGQFQREDVEFKKQPPQGQQWTQKQAPQGHPQREDVEYRKQPPQGQQWTQKQAPQGQPQREDVEYRNQPQQGQRWTQKQAPQGQPRREDDEYRKQPPQGQQWSQKQAYQGQPQREDNEYRNQPQQGQRWTQKQAPQGQPRREDVEYRKQPPQGQQWTQKQAYQGQPQREDVEYRKQPPQGQQWSQKQTQQGQQRAPEPWKQQFGQETFIQEGQIEEVEYRKPPPQAQPWHQRQQQPPDSSSIQRGTEEFRKDYEREQSDFKRQPQSGQAWGQQRTQKGPEISKQQEQQKSLEQLVPAFQKPLEVEERGASAGRTFPKTGEIGKFTGKMEQEQPPSFPTIPTIKKDSKLPPQKELEVPVEELPSKLATMAIETPVIETSKAGDSSASTSSEASKSISTRQSPKKTQYVKCDITIKMNPTIEQKFLPKRPDTGGKKGREIKLIINCLNMKINPMKIFMYNIDLTKAEVINNNKKMDVKLKMERKEALREVVSAYLKDKKGAPVFDGGKIIFTNQLLPLDNNNVNKLQTKFMKDDEEVTCYFDIQRVKEEDIELSALTHYVESGQGRSDTLPQEALRALDTIMKEMFINKNLISLNRRAIFDPKTEKPLRCGPYLLIDGYATTIRPHMWKIRFNFDKTQIVLHKPMNLYDYISELTNNFRFFNPDAIKKKIHLLRVESSHLKNSDGKSYSRKYTIHGFSRKDATQERIEDKNCSIEQYFLKEYGIRLKYPKLVLIKTNPNKATYLPIELLNVLPHQKVLVNDPKIVQEVIRSAAIPAFDRLANLKSAIKTLKFGDRADKFIKNYMIEIDETLINVTGRILEGPEARFGGKAEFLRGGKWDFRSKRFFQAPPDTINWALFAVGTERDYSRNDKPLYEIENQLPDSAGRVGVKLAPMFLFQYIPWQRIEIELPAIIKDSEKAKKRLELLVFVIIRDDDYKAVKRFGDMTYGIVTQCMKYATLERQRALDQYMANIMLKVNTKLGGINWELSALVNRIFSPIKGRFMVFGIDVTHPAATKNDLSKSVAAVVGSLDNTASLYSAVIRQQISKDGQSIVEVVLNMKEMVHKLLMNFYTSNKQLKPDHLLFYRDGVSEGQFRIVFNHEIIAIQDACLQLHADYQPKITYIVVQKRHKIRFFPSDSRDAIGKSQNVPSGTVVDKDITHCREFDFYLCSHEGIQGTSKPAHYHVLFDENNWGSDDLQSFTYFLCHVYARSTRSVSYPAPTYYAHLAAFRGRALIGELSDDSSSSASGHTQRSATESTESEISIHDYHNNKLFFI